jgi:hypothetical protein
MAAERLAECKLSTKMRRFDIGQLLKQIFPRPVVLSAFAVQFQLCANVGKLSANGDKEN